jgi:hypothetical protein
MTEEQAHAMIGRRARIMDDSYEVPQGTEGTVRGAMSTGRIAFIANGEGGKLPEGTRAGRHWANNMACDDALRTIVLIYEWDSSIEAL